jgi:putative pyruvate formate lyase activating enzyme
MLRITEDHADIYLPDFKYSDPHLANNLSGCKDYPDAALLAITEMIRQKGFLDSLGDPKKPAQKGVLVRHLILPGKIMNSINALTTLFLEVGPELPLSLMSQYQPVVQFEDKTLNQTLTEEEFNRAYSHALELGFKNMFVQFPEGSPLDQTEPLPFLPDFRKRQPFLGNKS